MSNILNLDGKPRDPLEAILWLSGVKDAVERELEAEYRRAYAEARLSGRFEAAIALGVHRRKTALRYTRQHNNENGRMIRWGDGLDPHSSIYRGY
jgi:hypothetical protein